MTKTCSQTGFSIVELMISVTISLMLLSGLLSLFLHYKGSFNQNEAITRMQEDARFAMDELTRDVGMAGFVADVLDPTSVVPDGSLSIVTDCGPPAAVDWIYEMRNPVTGANSTLATADNVTAASVGASFSCINGGSVRPGTDVIALKRVVGRTAPAIEAGKVYVRTNGTVGLLYREPMAAPPAIPVPPPFRDWEFRPAIYFIQNFAVTPGDNIPTLCRMVLRPGVNPDMAPECIAQGIEDLQAEFGIDTDGDGAAEFFAANPTPAEMGQAVSVRVFLLARSVNNDTRYDNDKTYNLSNAPAYTPNDNFHRRVFATTVLVRNLKNSRRLGI
ncbi:MAG: PilW family protein [Gammaproteobacteria bacterium]